MIRCPLRCLNRGVFSGGNSLDVMKVVKAAKSNLLIENGPNLSVWMI